MCRSASCSPRPRCTKAPERRTFTLQGQVQSLDAPRKLVIVKHEEIKGFMPAMTMPYEVEDAKAIDALAPGDLINATLVVFSNGAHLTGIKKVGTRAAREAAGRCRRIRRPRPGSSCCKPGEAVPDGKFVDQDGKARRFGAFKGSPVAMTFIYTKCPLPTFCPLMDRHFVTLQKTLKADPALKDVQLVTVSFDPVDRYAGGPEEAREEASTPT